MLHLVPSAPLALPLPARERLAHPAPQSPPSNPAPRTPPSPVGPCSPLPPSPVGPRSLRRPLAQAAVADSLHPRPQIQPTPCSCLPVHGQKTCPSASCEGSGLEPLPSDPARWSPPSPSAPIRRPLVPAADPVGAPTLDPHSKRSGRCPTSAHPSVVGGRAPWKQQRPASLSLHSRPW